MNAFPPFGRAAPTALARIAAVAVPLLTFSQPGLALDRDWVLRFLPPTNAPVTGYTVFLTDVATELEELLDIGFVAPGPDGVASLLR